MAGASKNKACTRLYCYGLLTVNEPHMNYIWYIYTHAAHSIAGCAYNEPCMQAPVSFAYVGIEQFISTVYEK